MAAAAEHLDPIANRGADERREHADPSRRSIRLARVDDLNLAERTGIVAA